MDYYLDFWYNEDEEMIEKYKYIIMMNLDVENLSKLSKKSKVVGKYMEEIERVNQDPKFIEYMSTEEDERKMMNTMLKRAREEGLEEGLEQGIEQGIEQGKIELMKKLLEKGFSKEEVSDLLDVPINDGD